MDDFIKAAQARAAEAARRVADAIERDERVANAADTLSARARSLGRTASHTASDLRVTAADKGARLRAKGAVARDVATARAADVAARVRDVEVPRPRGVGVALAIGLAAVGGYMAYQAAQRRKIDAKPQDDAPETSARRGPQPGLLSGEANIARSVTINRTPQEVYDYWRDFSNLPNFMENLADIEAEGDRLDWSIKAPGGATVAVKTRVTEDVSGEVIAWESTDESAITTKGRVTFAKAPADRGTIVTLRIDYNPPGGRIGQLAAKLMRREPAVQAAHELRRLRMLLETGEIATGERTKAKAAEKLGQDKDDHNTLATAAAGEK